MEPQREVDDDVQALKREVELLKTLLHQERKKSSSNSARLRDVSPVRPASPAKPMPTDRLSRASSSIIKPPQSSVSAARDSEIAKGSERSPRRNIALSGASQRGKSMRWNNFSGGGQTFNAAAATVRERALYLQHIPVDTKRGKWWLKDRQILSWNVPSPYDDCVAVKVRETWLWSGRTVIVDKIVTCPNTQDDSNDELDAPAFEDEQNGERGVVREEEDEQACERPPERSLPPVVVLGDQLYSDSKQLAQEFLQQPSKATGGAMMETQVDANEPLQAASARMELRMSMSAAQAATQERLDEDRSERQHVDDQQSPAQQALASSGLLVPEHNHVVETLLFPRARVEETIKYIDGAKRSIELGIY